MQRPDTRLVREGLLRNRGYDARNWSLAYGRQLGVLQEFLVILRQRLDRRLGPHRDYLVTLGLQPAQKFGQRFRGVLVEVVQQDDAFAELVESLEGDVDHLLGVLRLEVERVEVAGENRDVAGAEIGDHLR